MLHRSFAFIGIVAGCRPNQKSGHHCQGAPLKIAVFAKGLIERFPAVYALPF